MFGGSIENGESDLEAIKRELEEEINIDVKRIEKIDELYVKKNRFNLGEDYEVSLFCGYADTSLNEIELNEGRDINYFKLKELSIIKFPIFYRDFIIKNQNKIFH